ncbi:FtsK/SpoIIIE domain-containing protein [Actinacidiphila paucisporea]|uniref:DNA segregation ATPase FtsK/SpoIIIE, S-DNA-T family n=1 Tax=Actinacidiphila paucisporea TaxID=310782 RepID=A0A1M6TGD4_9ACTN|nr:FtsK/SpoIIIE domain-containing protein [Actinacidiphila paucisporea]SHK56041.1 DNA segregation ATPase FtsK/SpoIIIE, S-DNA-T family [Actinacidiphila paucisporea]
MTENPADTEPPTLAPVVYLPGSKPADAVPPGTSTPASATLRPVPGVLDSARRVLAGVDLTTIDVKVTDDHHDFDAFADTPLIPVWMRSREGWAAFAGVFYRARRRDARRWVRRQRTDRGHLAQARRGTRRLHDWVVGFEGVQVQATAHAAHIATKEARAAARTARFTPVVMRTKKDLAMKAAATSQAAAIEAVALHKQAKKDRRRMRNLRAGVVYGPPATAVLAGYTQAGLLGLSGGVMAAFAEAAFAGRHPVGEETDWSQDWRSLGDGDVMNAPMLDAVFRAAKVIGKEESLRAVRMPMMDATGAWSAVVDLPPGIPAKTALRAQPELASAFGIADAQLSLTKLNRSGRLELYVSRELPFTRPAERGPLLGLDGPANFWGRISIGPDVRGLPVSISVVERSGLVGGEPGAGKSASGNTILLAAALDPRVILHLADGKGGGDLEPFEPLCEQFEGDADPEAFNTMLDDEIADMRNRYALLKRLGKRKVTEALADAHPELRQKLVWVDELMFYTTDEDYGKKITKKLRNLVSRGRAAGIITFCATQKPGSDVVDTSLRDLLSIRWALRCTTPEASDTILGKGAAASGFSAKTIESEMRGAGFLWAEGSNPVLVRADYYTDDQVNELLGFAHGLRTKAGTLPRTALPLADRLREHGDDDAALLAVVLDTFTAAGPSGEPAEWLPGSVLLDAAKSSGIDVTPERLAALVVRSDGEKIKRPWGEKGSRVSGYPLDRIRQTIADRYGLTA